MVGRVVLLSRYPQRQQLDSPHLTTRRVSQRGQQPSTGPAIGMPFRSAGGRMSAGFPRSRKACRCELQRPFASWVLSQPSTSQRRRTLGSSGSLGSNPRRRNRR